MMDSWPGSQLGLAGAGCARSGPFVAAALTTVGVLGPEAAAGAMHAAACTLFAPNNTFHAVMRIRLRALHGIVSAQMRVWCEYDSHPPYTCGRADSHEYNKNL